MVEKVCIKDIIKAGREQKLLNAVDKFSCQDEEVEKFLKQKALDFDRRNKSRTYLLIDSEAEDEIVIFGYYTLTMKSLPFEFGISKSTIKKIDGFRSDVNSTEAILIGQLGKDYKHNKINGKTILDYILDDVYKAQTIIGGRIVFLECLNIEKIVDFYKQNGFVILQNSSDGNYLQMIRFL